MDPHAFREHLVEELDSVYRLAMHLTGNADEAADLAQDTYMRALRASDRFELREHGIRPWLFKILHNCFYSRVNRKQREPRLSEDLQWASGQTPPASVPAADHQGWNWDDVDERLKHAIEDLPTHHRSVLLMWAVEGFKYREIADVLDVPIGTVMSRLSRARTVLADQLGELAAENGMTPALGSREASKQAAA